MEPSNRTSSAVSEVEADPWAWRDRLAHQLSRGFFFVYAFGSFLFWLTLRGRWQQHLIAAFAACCALLIAPSAFAGRPAGRMRAWLLVGPACLAASIGFAAVGFLSGPAVMLTVILMLSGLLLGRRVMLALSVLTGGTIATIAWAMVHGIIQAPSPLDVSMTNSRDWARSIGVMYMAICLFGTILTSLVNRLTETVEQVRAEIGRRERAERARNEAELAALEAKRMEAIGRLAAGVAHDFNNNLTAIIGNAELLRLDLQSPEQTSLLALADEILASSQRATELTRQLLVSSRKNQITRAPVDLHALINDTLTLFRRSTDPRITIQTDLLAEEAMVSGDQTLLQSAFLNLLLNAKDAMPEGGRLFIATVSSMLTPGRHSFGDGLAAGPYLFVEVTDTGTGIAKDVLGRIFEPFFTTKPVGKGTGLGLAAVAGTVKSMGGAIDVHSEPGVGTAFRLILPRRMETADAPPSGDEAGASDSSELQRGRGVILVVEDESGVRQTALTSLSALGYQVVEARDGTEAVTLARTKQSFDLVLLDLRMPKLSGEATFDILRSVRPQLPVLLWSGYGDEHDVQRMLRRGAKGFVQKPFRLVELSRAVAAALDKTAH